MDIVPRPPVGVARPRLIPPLGGVRERTRRAASSIPRMGAIDLFRGVAILLVILYHVNGNIIFPGGWGLQRGADGVAHLSSGSAVLRLVFLPFHLGRVGVNLFFVISGLCIHLRFAVARVEDPEAAFPLKVFFARRFFRIYPVYWAALVLGIIFGPFVYAGAQSPVGLIEKVTLPTLGSIAAHVVMIHTFFGAYFMDILRPLWSIAVEEQFYLLYPLVFVLLGRFVRVPHLVVGLLAAGLAWRAGLVFSNPAPRTYGDGPFLVWVFGFSVARYYEWSLGALLAWAMANRRPLAMFPFAPIRFLGARPRLVIALGVGMILMGAASLFRVRLKWMIEDPCYSTGWFLILAAVLLPSTARRVSDAHHDHGPGPRLLGELRTWVARRLRGLGRRSYSVYLLHELALMAVVALMHRFSLPPITVAAPLAGLAIWLLCYPFYRYVEAPFERISKSVAAAPPIAAPGGVPGFGAGPLGAGLSEEILNRTTAPPG